MPARTNVSSTRRTVSALRTLSRLGPEHAGLIALGETTARALDLAIASDEKAYALANLARAHAVVLQVLLAVGKETSLDPFAAFVAGLTTPTFVTPPELED
jgi:hypothetical protein